MSTSQATQQSSSTRTDRILASVIALPISLLSLALLIYSIRVEPQHQKLLKLYQSSPSCISTAYSSAALSPCTYVSERIVNKRYQHESKSADEYYITLQHTNEVPHEVRVIGHLLWDRAVVGGSVTTKSFHGEIVGLKAYGYRTITDANPLYVSHSDSSNIPLGVLGTVFWGFFFVVGWMPSRPKSTNAKHCYAPGFFNYPLSLVLALWRRQR